MGDDEKFNDLADNRISHPHSFSDSRSFSSVRDSDCRLNVRNGAAADFSLTTITRSSQDQVAEQTSFSFASVRQEITTTLRFPVRVLPHPDRALCLPELTEESYRVPLARPLEVKRNYAARVSVDVDSSGRMAPWLNRLSCDPRRGAAVIGVDDNFRLWLVLSETGRLLEFRGQMITICSANLHRHS